jgi:hypothetical protein
MTSISNVVFYQLTNEKYLFLVTSILFPQGADIYLFAMATSPVM